MDIDEDHDFSNPDIDMDEDGDQIVEVEVMPGIHARTKPKAKRYENSVSLLYLERILMIYTAFYRMFL
jgi:hypothetical protein